MHHHANRYGLIAAFLVCAATLAACGGGGGGGGGSTLPPGGGGSSPTPVPSNAASPSPSPAGSVVSLPSASPASPSQVSINSNPTALSVSIDGAAAGTTPVTPTVGYGAHTIVFTPKTSASPFAVTVTNTGTSAIAVFYNQTADSAGKIAAGISTAGIAHGRAAQSLAGTPQRRPAALAGRAAFAATRISVQYDVAALGARTFDGVEAAHGIARAQTFVQSSARVTRVLDVAAGADVDAALAGLRAEPGVLTASRVGLRYPAAATSGTFYPNDTYFKATNNGANADQWYLWLVDAQDAWGYGPGTAPIAVIDTGSDPKQTEIAGLVTFSESIVNLQSYPDAVDHDGHGTYLSGIVDAQINNGAGFAGMAYNAPLQEYKIFADGSSAAQTTDEAAAIRDAVAHGAKVILLALQSSPAAGPDPVERDAVAYAIQNGVTVIAASGDDNGTALDYPAGYPGVISVGASIVNDAGTPGVVVGQGNSEAVASYSNAGPGLGLVAPGGQGTSGDTNLLHWIEGSYTTQPSSGLPACAAGTAAPDCKILFSGTSPAAALVAGTAALMLTVNTSLTPAQVAQMLYATADDIKDPKQGHGRLNAQRAVALAAGDATAVPPPPLPRAVQFVAIAYTNSGAALPATPTIINLTYKSGIPVNQDGTFRIADLPATLPGGGNGYKIAIWLSLAGDGKVHPGDYFTAVTCTLAASCSAALPSLTATKLATNASTLP